MDAAEIRSFDRSSLKSEARRFLEKSDVTHAVRAHLNLQWHLVRLLAIWKQIANAAVKINLTVGIGGIRIFGNLFPNSQQLYEVAL